MPRAPERGTHEVAADEAGRRLDVVVAELLGESRTVAQRLIKDGHVEVAGRPAGKQHRVQAGETLAWEKPPPAPQELVPESAAVPIIYEDDWLLVADKPAGMVVHPAPGHEAGTLVHALLDHGIAGGHGRRPGVIHRLDRETSGLLIVARSEVAYRRLVATMSARRVERTYIALLCRRARAGRGHHRRADRPSRARSSPHVRAQRAGENGGDALPRARSRRRLHARAKCASRPGAPIRYGCTSRPSGYPVAGDATYGGRPRPEGLDASLPSRDGAALPSPGGRSRARPGQPAAGGAGGVPRASGSAAALSVGGDGLGRRLSPLGAFGRPETCSGVLTTL